MSNLHLYPPVKVRGKSFKGVKVVSVPNQSMTLAEIIKRFKRRESLPVEKQGFYEDRMGDLEKMSREDITVQMERAADLKQKIKAAEKRMETKAKKQKDEQEKANSQKAAAEGKSGQAGASSSVEEKV